MFRNVSACLVQDSQAPDAEPEEESGKQIQHVRSLAHNLLSQPSPTVQNGIDDLLRKLWEKYGGEPAGSNMFFSEGDDDKKGRDEVSPAVRAADHRIARKNSRRNVKHATHSGVLSPQAAQALNVTASSEED